MDASDWSEVNAFADDEDLVIAHSIYCDAARPISKRPCDDEDWPRVDSNDEATDSDFYPVKHNNLSVRFVLRFSELLTCTRIYPSDQPRLMR